MFRLASAALDPDRTSASDGRCQAGSLQQEFMNEKKEAALWTVVRSRPDQKLQFGSNKTRQQRAGQKLKMLSIFR